MRLKADGCPDSGGSDVESTSVSVSMPVSVSVRQQQWSRLRRLLGSDLGGGFEKRFEDGVGPLVVVVHDVHEVMRVHDVGNGPACVSVVLVYSRPLSAQFVRLVLPGHEADGFNDSRLYDFLSGENTPRYSVGTVGMVIRPKITSLVDHVVCDAGVTLDLWYQSGQELW